MKVEGRDVPNPIAEFSQTTFPPIIMQQIAQIAQQIAQQIWQIAQQVTQQITQTTQQIVQSIA